MTVLDRLGDRRRILSSRHDVIGEHLGQRRLVLWLEQPVDRARRQLLESRVDGREYRERPRALQRVDQPGRLDRRDQRRVVLRIYGVVDNVFVLYIAAPPTIGLPSPAFRI